MTRAARIAAALLLGQTLLVGWIAVRMSPVLDELPHLAAGIAHWRFGTFDLYRVNPPLVRMIAALPGLAMGIETDWMGGWPDDPHGRPEFPLGRRLGRANGPDVFRQMTAARWACLPFLWLGGWVCFVWARQIYGDAAGLTAVGLWCVCPNVLAWGGTICPDLAAASTGLWAGYAFWNWWRSPDAGRLATAAVALGVALLTKSTWIVLLGLWPALAAVWWWTRDAGSGVSGLLRRRLLSLGGLLAGALYVVHVGYGFAGALQPLGKFEFISRSLAGELGRGETGNRFRGTWLADCPSPLPADYLRGIDVQRYDFEQRKWSYLRGAQRLGGWWWYYLYALGVKTPLGTLALLATALLTAYSRRGTARRCDELVLLAPAIAVLVLVSSQTGFNRYLRYVLPAVPFLFVWGSRVVGDTSALAAAPRAARFRAACAVLCLAASAVSSLRLWPHSLSYFHELAGGPVQGPRHLLDANVDWGQGLLAVRDWIAAHPDARPLFFKDFGWVDPEQAGIASQPVPRLLFDTDGSVTEGDLAEVVPGWYVVSVNHLWGYRHYDSDRPVYAWLREFAPVARPGYANCIFRLTEEDVAAFHARHGFDENAAGPPVQVRL